MPIPAEGQVAVAVAGGAKGVKVKSAPAGVTVAGGVKKGRLAVAVVRPRGVAASGKVVFTLRGKAKGVKTFGAALDGGKAGAVCKDLGALLAKRLKGTADMKALSPILAAKLCGKAAPGRRRGRAAAARPGRAADPAGHAGAASAGQLAAPGRRAPRGRRRRRPRRPRPCRAAQRPCDNDRDDDGDGQTDWEDPGCLDAGDKSEDGEVPGLRRVRGERRRRHGRRPDRARRRHQRRLREVLFGRDRPSRPAIASCTANNGFECTVFDPIADASVGLKDPEARHGRREPRAQGARSQCDKKFTIAFYRRNGEVAELHGAGPQLPHAARSRRRSAPTARTTTATG